MKHLFVLIGFLFSVYARASNREVIFRCGEGEFRLEKSQAVISSPIALKHFSERAGQPLPIKNSELAAPLVGDAAGSFEFKATVPGTPFQILGQWGDGYEVILADAQGKELAAAMFDSCEF